MGKRKHIPLSIKLSLDKNGEKNCVRLVGGVGKIKKNLSII